VGDRSRGRHATSADSPLHDGTPYRGLRVRRWGFRFVHRQGPFSVAPCQTLAIRNFCVAAGDRHVRADGARARHVPARAGNHRHVRRLHAGVHHPLAHAHGGEFYTTLAHELGDVLNGVSPIPPVTGNAVHTPSTTPGQQRSVGSQGHAQPHGLMLCRHHHSDFFASTCGPQRASWVSAAPLSNAVSRSSCARLDTREV
jgi:hypothetical protein